MTGRPGRILWIKGKGDCPYGNRAFRYVDYIVSSIRAGMLLLGKVARL